MEPSGKREYLQNYGWHFSKKACMYATRNLKKRVSPDSEKTEVVKPYTYDQVEDLFTKFGIKLQNDSGYDKVYIASKAKANCLGSSLPDEQHLIMYTRDFLDDVDGGSERAFRHWYSDMIEKGVPIMWEDLI